MANVCAWYGMAHEEPTYQLRFGIFGGMTPKERETFMRRYEITTDRARAEYEAERAHLWELVCTSNTVVDWPRSCQTTTEDT